MFYFGARRACSISGRCLDGEVQHGRGLERLGGGEEGVCQQDQPRGRRGRAREARGGEGLLLREGRGVSD
jgi:hypothetical protein